MDVLHGPVLDLSLLESSLMRQELSVLYPDHAASASNTKHASKISSKPSSMAAAGSRSPSTAKTSSRKSSRSSSKESRLLQDRSLSADAELSALTVSIQETNNLMRETNFLYGGAIARIEGLLVSCHLKYHAAASSACHTCRSALHLSKLPPCARLRRQCRHAWSPQRHAQSLLCTYPPLTNTCKCM